MGALEGAEHVQTTTVPPVDSGVGDAVQQGRSAVAGTAPDTPSISTFDVKEHLLHLSDSLDHHKAAAEELLRRLA